ncbi:hypothetical protein [Rhodococcus sp. 14-2470-1a]|uniref:hypothetical protein n=1 Tax=Rhodococcus sp. 14-2470-1a TaxID=2023150 RepID=UPI000B9B2D6D|nr:hypothetical protein [Rhodococcus sp. 14-2470-1a]OZF47537.1 hypothetical protein CH292_19115 [Rhodococcus sp. 14-2470-1a]
MPATEHQPPILAGMAETLVYTSHLVRARGARGLRVYWSTDPNGKDEPLQYGAASDEAPPPSDVDVTWRAVATFADREIVGISPPSLRPHPARVQLACVELLTELGITVHTVDPFDPDDESG